MSRFTSDFRRAGIAALLLALAQLGLDITVFADIIIVAAAALFGGSGADGSIPSSTRPASAAR